MFYFQKLIKKKKRKNLISLCIAGCLFVCLFILFQPILFKSWLAYPSELRAKIAFLKWQASFQGDCYGQCLRDRQVLKEIFLRDYQANYASTLKILKDEYLYTDNDNYSLAIVKVLSELSNFLPSDWLFLVETDISLNSKKYLMHYFPEAFQDNENLKELLKANLSNSLVSLDDKQISLAMLSIYSDSNQYFLDVILGDYSLILKKEALRNVSNLSQDQLSSLGNSLLGQQFDVALNSHLVWLISDYYYIYPELSAQYLSLVYQSQSLDVFSRGFAALALNEVLQADLRVPDLDSTKWQEYYLYN